MNLTTVSELLSERFFINRVPLAAMAGGALPFLGVEEALFSAKWLKHLLQSHAHLFHETFIIGYETIVIF